LVPNYNIVRRHNAGDHKADAHWRASIKSDIQSLLLILQNDSSLTKTFLSFMYVLTL
jgi:hypothetical protein